MNKKELISKIKTLTDISSEERAYLIELVNTKKKYGLVWEDKPEDVEEQLRSMLPVLNEVKDKAIINGAEHPNHILIEGDNLHALTALTFTHEGKIDVIYIDPPYNRGDNDFIYNDDYIDKEDTFRHSKWLSFMSKRLLIAKKLLSSDGIIFISIDKNEIAQLKLLMDEIFGEKNYIEIFSWVKTETPSNLSSKSKEKLEYILCYQKQQNNIRFKGLMKTSSSDNPMMKHQNSIKDLTFTPGQLTVKIREPKMAAGRYGTTKYDIELLNDLYINEGTNYNEVTLRGKFIWTQNNLVEELSKGTVMTIKTKTMILSYEKKEYDPEVPPNLIDNSFGVGTNENAEAELIALDLNEFDYPKPSSLIDYLLKFNGKNNGVILDFFAGSGTTLDALMQLNKKDNGCRIGIICTNNQNGIAENICYERNKRKITGYTSTLSHITESLVNNNLRYYKACFIPSERTEVNRRKLTQESTDLLCIKEDCYNNVSKEYFLNEKEAKLFTNGLGKFMLVVYHSRNQMEVVEKLTGIIPTIETTEKIKLYAFSPEKETIEADFLSVADKIEAVPLPDSIYNAYRATFRTLKLDNKQAKPVYEPTTEQE
jgi:adenine-specific DNA-methyltransferase